MSQYSCENIKMNEVFFFTLDREFVRLNLILYNVPQGDVHSKIMDGLQKELSTNYIKFIWSAPGCIILCVDVMLDALGTYENLMSEFSLFFKKVKAVGKLWLDSEDSIHVVMIPVEGLCLSSNILN